MAGIVTLTMNPTIDTSTSTSYVIAEQKLRCRQPRDDPGGGGINVSRAIKKLGGESKAFYFAGGWYGEKLKELLDREKIDHVPIPIQGSTRQDLIILDERSKKQYRFQTPGPELQESELDACYKALSEISPRPEYLVASGSLPPGVPEDFYARVGRLAHEFGSRFIVDTSGSALVHAARAGAFLLKPNLKELQILVQHDVEDESRIEGAAREVLETGEAEVLVVSLGAGGALLATREHLRYLRAPTVPIVSKVGAGDSMVGGIVLKLAEGEAIETAVQYGVAAGAAAVMTPGTELCRKDDTDRLFQKMAAAPGSEK
ncbi:MAG: 1-phosphofructokinase family hexose kinase [Candidatus Abyssobacteria bacterium SURF_5]|uniref:1-phosphofructokinase family hexose kinase n=1 Tax=Abyssobacteria bacterium (strain SURF_5) TaxID=2093360 RepID=A0A3A4N9C9_ABYX5|nr:MAG: 1-phosphofructokinase family hexose kinase [Candidatus Abyssubacteria bacterium SURF_5]